VQGSEQEVADMNKQEEKEQKEMNKKGMVMAKALFKTAELQLSMINRLMASMNKEAENAKKKKT
jgi:hypothetical protein